MILPVVAEAAADSRMRRRPLGSDPGVGLPAAPNRARWSPARGEVAASHDNHCGIRQEVWGACAGDSATRRSGHPEEAIGQTSPKIRSPSREAPTPPQYDGKSQSAAAALSAAGPPHERCPSQPPQGQLARRQYHGELETHRWMDDRRQGDPERTDRDRYRARRRDRLGDRACQPRARGAARRSSTIALEQVVRADIPRLGEVRNSPDGDPPHGDARFGPG